MLLAEVLDGVPHGEGLEHGHPVVVVPSSAAARHYTVVSRRHFGIVAAAAPGSDIVRAPPQAGQRVGEGRPWVAVMVGIRGWLREALQPILRVMLTLKKIGLSVFECHRFGYFEYRRSTMAKKINFKGIHSKFIWQHKCL